MREFLHGWRRKVGCVTLVMACALAGMWVRSISHIDCLNYDHQHTVLGVESFEQTLVFSKGHFDRSFAQSLSSSSHRFVDHREAIVSSILFLCEDIPENDCFLPPTVPEVRRWGDFSSGTILVLGLSRSHYDFCVIPYWSIVIPLTLLSADLLLWKPRQRTGKDHG